MKGEVEQRLSLLKRPETNYGSLAFHDLFDLDEIQETGAARCKASNIRIGTVKPGVCHVSYCHSAGLLDWQAIKEQY